MMTDVMRERMIPEFPVRVADVLAQAAAIARTVPIIAGPWE